MIEDLEVAREENSRFEETLAAIEQDNARLEARKKDLNVEIAEKEDDLIRTEF